MGEAHVAAGVRTRSLRAQAERTFCLVKRAREVVDTLRGREPAYDPATYGAPGPYEPSPSASPAPASIPEPENTRPGYEVEKGEGGWRLLKDGELEETFKRKEDATRAGRAQARAAKGTLQIFKVDGSLGDEGDYASS